MKTMKTVESRVLEILRDCPETRNEDMLLFYRYYNRFADYLRAGELPLEDLALSQVSPSISPMRSEHAKARFIEM